MQSSYSWSGVRVRIGDHEHWRLDQHVWAGDPVVRYLHFTSVPMPAEDEDEVWRTAYRVKVPEKEAPLWGLLATRMEQHGGATATVSAAPGKSDACSRKRASAVSSRSRHATSGSGVRRPICIPTSCGVNSNGRSIVSASRYSTSIT